MLHSCKGLPNKCMRSDLIRFHTVSMLLGLKISLLVLSNTLTNHNDQIYLIRTPINERMLSQYAPSYMFAWYDHWPQQCCLYSIFTSQSNKLRPTVKVVVWYIFQHIFVPASSIARWMHFLGFLWNQTLNLGDSPRFWCQITLEPGKKRLIF